MRPEPHRSVAPEGLLEPARLLPLEEERPLDPLWAEALGRVASYLGRPAKRVRPRLLMLGYALARGEGPTPAGVERFASALELLHGFMLVHDDVADRANLRRGGPALHLELADASTAAGAHLGESLAVVAGDHLYARALELMLDTDLPAAPQAVRFMLQVCRHTAVGQYLDLKLSTLPLSEVTLFQTLRVAHLKTARYGFVAPLVCGAMLGDGAPELLDALSRLGRHAGVAFQLQDDLLGLFGSVADAGKAGDGDYFEGKRTFPLIAAWTRADEQGRAELASLWQRSDKTPESCAQARAAVDRHGGRTATQRAVERSQRAARRGALLLPSTPARAQLDALLDALTHRTR